MNARFTPTSSQTIGPYFAEGLLRPEDADVVAADDPHAIVLTGTIHDGRGTVGDALVEIWHADAGGGLPTDGPGSPSSGCFGRAVTDPEGSYRFHTVLPGPIADHRGARQAPHIDLSVFTRGLNNRAVTRVYFGDRAAENAEDYVLGTIDEARAATLIAEPVDGADRPTYRFDVHLQGDDETVFFDV